MTSHLVGAQAAQLHMNAKAPQVMQTVFPTIDCRNGSKMGLCPVIVGRLVSIFDVIFHILGGFSELLRKGLRGARRAAAPVSGLLLGCVETVDKIPVFTGIKAEFDDRRRGCWVASRH